jgi:hypothetical protein
MNNNFPYTIYFLFLVADTCSAPVTSLSL